MPDLIADKKKKKGGRARHLEQTQKLMWCQKLKKKNRKRERKREQISSARVCISIHTMGLSQRLRLFLCYYMLLERANKRKLPQKISPDGSYQRHLHRQIKWAISLKTICMFPACYESALCQANSLPECSKYYEKKRPYFSSLVHAALIKSMSIHAHVYSHVRCVSLHVFLFVFCVFSSLKKDITLIHIWGHLSHHFLFL